jgi:hypothetical protein
MVWAYILIKPSATVLGTLTMFMGCHVLRLWIGKAAADMDGSCVYFE